MTYNSLQAHKLIDMPAATLRSLHRRGFAKPEGDDGRWTQRQLVALQVLWASRRQGATLTASVAAYELLRGKEDNDLIADFEAGRRFLVLIGEMMNLRLVPEQRAYDRKLLEQAVSENLPLIVVDVQRIFESISENEASENFHQLSPSDAERVPG